ncbi:hypothetical protein PDIDSM_124 [Penicillium digitatum]|nr:hypothetical protein PDIDSM_124 [Penicillium digitatum]
MYFIPVDLHMLPYIIRSSHIKPNIKPNTKPTTLEELLRVPIPTSQAQPLFLASSTSNFLHPRPKAMTNQKNMRGNPNPNTNQTQSDTLAPAPSPSTPNTPSNQPPAPPSLATRIQASATSLAKSAFRPSSDLANTLASSTSSKPDPSSLPNPQTSRDPPSNTTLHGSPGSASASAAQAFREHNAHASTADKHVLPALTEDDFQGRKHRHDGIDTGDERQTDLLHTTTTVTDPKASTIQPHKDLQTPSSAWKGKARAHDPTQHQFETVWQRQWHVLHDPQTRVTATTDGAAVVSLLSDANFDPNFEDPMSVPDAEIDFAAVPASLSVAERDMLDSFRRGLGLDGKREGEGNGRLTGASLVPDLDVFLSQGFGAGVGLGRGRECYDHGCSFYFYFPPRCCSNEPAWCG